MTEEVTADYVDGEQINGYQVGAEKVDATVEKMSELHVKEEQGDLEDLGDLEDQGSRSSGLETNGNAEEAEKINGELQDDDANPESNGSIEVEAQNSELDTNGKAEETEDTNGELQNDGSSPDSSGSVDIEDEVEFQAQNDDDDEFGDFDEFDEFENFDEPQTTEPVQSPLSAFTSSKVLCLSDEDFQSTAQLQESVVEILKGLTFSPNNNTKAFELMKDVPSDYSASKLAPSSYFNERSSSLWSQLLMISTGDNPINWKRSSIRKLFLVSLGVPLDLDEIMPNKNTRRLVLPFSQKKNPKKSSGNKSKAEDGASSNNNNDSTNGSAVSFLDDADTDASLAEWNQLAHVSEIALQGMNEVEIVAHLDALKAATDDANKLLNTILKKKDSELKDKQTFEGVIESLLEYAQKLRKKSGKS